LTGFQYFTPSQTGNLFDSIGALMGLGQQAGRLNSNGELPRSSQSLVTIADGNMLGSFLGISPIVPYLLLVESFKARRVKSIQRC
jgi:AGZA family xanthine/uracil permease-like MFS transporter